MSYTGTNIIHATFNWNPAYDSYKHVALWGNDTIGDGSKTKPYRTITKAMSSNTVLNIVIGAGTYREAAFAPTNSAWNIQADGNVIIDVSNTSLFSAAFSIISGFLTGIYFRGSGNFVCLTLGDPSATFLNCTFENCHWSNKYLGTQTYCTYINAPNIQPVLNGSYCSYSYCTFSNCFLTFLPRNNNIFTKCIFSNCSILWTTDGSSAGWFGVTYNNLYNTGMKFPSQSTYTVYTDINTLKTAITALASTSFPPTAVNNLYFLDPLFSNPSHGDLSLSLTSPCKNMAYDGTIIGSKSIGLNFVASTNSAISAFDNSSLVNTTIDGTTGALTMTDATQLALATLKPFSNLLGRNILSLPNFGFFSDRSGQYIDATPDLDLTGVYTAGDTLTDSRVYIVDGSGGQIVYGGNTLAVGDRFTCKSSVATVFSNLSVASYVREIIEGPTRNNIECRFSNGTGTFKINGDTLTTGYWYYLSSGTATLSSLSYSAGQYIKGDGSAVSTSTGIIEEVFTTGGYQYYELFGQITCNRVGNVSTGAIIKGNGDPSFDRTTANMFKIADKHCQLRYTIQPANLIP
jgi:hypothetical protein